jgi:hypothetical protein
MRRGFNLALAGRVMVFGDIDIKTVDNDMVRQGAFFAQYEGAGKQPSSQSARFRATLYKKPSHENHSVTQRHRDPAIR